MNATINAARSFGSVRSAARGAASMIALLGMTLVGCAGGSGERSSTPPSPTDAPTPNESRAVPANTEKPSQPTALGAMTPEQMAEQAARDIEEMKKLNAARRIGNTPTPRNDGAMAANESRGATAPFAGPNNSAAVGQSNAGASAPMSAGATGAATRPDQSAVVAAAPAETTPDAPATTPPRRVLATPEAISGAAAALYRDAARADTPMRSLMALAALSIAEPDRPFNAEALPDLTEEERRALTRFHAFCRDLGQQLATSDDPEAVTRAVEQLAGEIRGERRLRVPRSDFCTRVDGFGAFARIEPREFVAHAGARFVLYFEIDGYRSLEVGSEGWKTELSVELSILSERDGVPVWRRDWQTITDLAATQRKDFFVTHVVGVPDALSVGAYVLKVRVRDELTGALAESAVPFHMVAAAMPSGSAGSESGTHSNSAPARSNSAR